MSVFLDCTKYSDWLTLARQALHYQGLVVLQGLLDDQLLRDAREALLVAQRGYYADIGPGNEQRARAQGDVDIRVPMKYHPQFFKLMEHPALLQLADACLGEDAVLRFANGFIQPPIGGVHQAAPYRQGRFHMNYKQVMHGFPSALDVLFVVDAGSQGALFDWAPGSHQRMDRPTAEYLEWSATPARFPTGSLVVMDPTLWHRECQNRDSAPWMSVHYEFVQPFLKPHMDYVRLLGPQVLAGLPPRTQRLLGVQAQVPASLEEFYLPAEQRVYQAGWAIGMDEAWTSR
jgi:ectoine hydroxylase-related dioxygenase (phytanoyl-CoA dioxygenase family)